MSISYPSSICPFLISGPRHHAFPKTSFYKRKQPFLLNDGVLPTASIFTESSEEIFPAKWHFVTKLDPQVSPFPVPIFGVNICPFNYRIKVI
jgi:hypothetical protein